MTMTTEAQQQPGGGFRRQVTFRIGPEDAPLLEAAARVHGGIQAGLVAALRAYAAQRLQAALPAEKRPDERKAPDPVYPVREERARERARPPAASPARPAATAAGEDENLVELNVAEAALVLGVSASGLRERIKRGTHPGRLGENGFYLAGIPREKLRASGVGLSPRGAAEVLGLRPSTIKSRCKQGRYPNARHGADGWSIPASDVL